jgi:hypothetical protein
MKYTNFICMMLLFSALIAACATSARSLPTAGQLLQSGGVPEGVGRNALKNGRALAVTQCAGCHRFFYPEEYTPENWALIIRRMGKLSSLDKKQAREITQYFQTASRLSQ